MTSISLDDHCNLVEQWLKMPDYRSERRFLEAHLELLDLRSEEILKDLIAQYAGQSDMMQSPQDHLALLRDITRRGNTIAAIREGYVNAFGGLILDLPCWLEMVERQIDDWWRTSPPDQIVAKRVTLLRRALGRAQNEKDHAPEILAELRSHLWSALDDTVGGDEWQKQEEGIACLVATLQIYTFARYPRLYARTQSNLGIAYQNRIEGKKSTNLEKSIESYREALCVYTYEDFPVEFAMVYNSLGIVYGDRVEGERRANLEQAITCYEEALCVYTYEDFPVEYATTQNNLGNAYRDRIEGKRRINLEQAIIYLQEALCIYTYKDFPIEHAMTQNNLGIVYGDRIEGERRANLEQAITCYQKALRVYTSEAFPVDYAMTQNNLGVAYIKLHIEGEGHNNLEQAITCYEEALRIRTCEAFPIEHRETQLNCAFAKVAQHNWEGAHNAYQSALSAEDLLLALGAGTIGRNIVLRVGGDAAVRDGFTLIQLARLPEAVEVIERGRAQGLAEAMVLDEADPRHIHNNELRKRYEDARDEFRKAQRELNLNARLLHDEREQRQLNLQYTEAYRQAKANFDVVMSEIQAAKDPADFLKIGLDSARILQVAEQEGSGHALVYVAATPWGGIAVAVLSANQHQSTSARFATLDLPSLMPELLDRLMQTQLSSESPHTIGGFDLAQEGYALDVMLLEWPGMTLQEKAMSLHRACVAANQISTLDAAMQAMLTVATLKHPTGETPPVWAHLIDQPLEEISDTDQELLDHTLNQLVLSLELSRCLEALADVALRPLVSWLQKQGATSLTLIPYGLLAAFPLTAVPLVDGRTVGETLPTSVAPSARSLLRDKQSSTKKRAGIYTLGNPRPTHQDLRWSEREANMLMILAEQRGLATDVRLRKEATREWLIEILREGYVVDASCHGSFNHREPLQSELLLALGERLILGEVLSHTVDLRGLRLLILSACQSAVLDLRGASNEVNSLAAGMVQAGAKSVLAALWLIDAMATYLLIVRFAQEWFLRLESEPPAAALARAQYWLRTTTNFELKNWLADDSPTLTVKSQTLEGLPLEDGTHKPFKTGTPQLGAMWVQDVMKDAIRRLQEWTQEDKDDNLCPYADPVYWSAFQLTGW